MKSQILEEIRRIAQANGNTPPGKLAFERATGISEGRWAGVFWARWNDAVKEAGFVPNERNKRSDADTLLRGLATACRSVGHFITNNELRMLRRKDSSFPANATLEANFGKRDDVVKALLEWTRSQLEYADVAEMAAAVEISNVVDVARPSEGLVYLIKSGGFYKIGRSDQIERRIKEIRVALPEAASLVHSIRTDDPPGIEAYWHRRFEDRRMNGEWFKLTQVDIAVFRRRTFQ